VGEFLKRTHNASNLSLASRSLGGELLQECLRRKRRVFGVLPFGIGLLTALVALASVVDANTRHAVAALGLALAIIGLVVMLRTNRSPRP